MKLIVLFLLFFLNSACQLDCMSRKTSFTVGIGATALGVGSLVWQLYTKDYSFKKSIVTGTFFCSGLASFLYNKYAQVQYLQQINSHNMSIRAQIAKKIIPSQERISELIESNDSRKIKELLDVTAISSNDIVFNNDLLWHAIDKGSFETCQLLIGYGAKIKSCHAAISICPTNSSMVGTTNKIFDLILDNFDVKIPSHKNKILLHHAAKFGTIYMLEAFIDLKMDIEAKDGFGDTPLLAAVKYNRIAMVDLLIKAGADPEVMTDAGESLLNHAKSPAIQKMIRKEILARKHFSNQDSYLSILPPEIRIPILNYTVNN